MPECFEATTLEIYGKCKEVSYLCLDLIWKPIGEKVRFVMVRDGSGKLILMCSDLTLSAPDIIRAYSYRFKIEVNFKVLETHNGRIFLSVLDNRLAPYRDKKCERSFFNR